MYSIRLARSTRSVFFFLAFGVLLPRLNGVEVPAVQMLIPGFQVRELPVELNNINNLRYRDDGSLYALGYDGDVWLLKDSNSDGLEDVYQKFFSNEGRLRGPIGMAVIPNGHFLLAASVHSHSIASAGGKVPRSRNTGGEEPTQQFRVDVPKNAQPGQPFALLAGGVRVLVTCPMNAKPGQRICFKLPLALTQKPTTTNEAAQIKLKYDKDGWVRSVRATDLFFQWVRMDDKGDLDMNKRFDPDKSAYVRKLDFVPGEDPRIRTGFLSLVPASEAVVESKIKSTDNRVLVCYSDIANAQVKNFEEKAQWFQDICAQLCVDWNDGHVRMNVRRQFLLGDSVDAVMSLSRKDLRKLWRFEFIGEMGIDAGGLAREWFQLVTEEIFNPNVGLWQSSAANQMCMQINPASGE